MVTMIPPDMLQKYNDRFNSQKLSQVKRGVVQQRKWTDIVCFIVFLLLVAVFIIFSVIFWVNTTSFNQLKNKLTVKNSTSDFSATFVKVAGTVIGMLVLSIFLSITFVFLCSKFPKCVVYTAIITTFILYIAIIVLAIIAGVWALAIVTIVVALITACLLYCFRKQIQIGIILLKISGQYMIHNPQITFVGVVSLLLNIVLTVIFVLGWIAAYSQTLPQNNSEESSRNRFKGMMYGYFFMTIFFGFFLYYLMVFVVGTAVGYWYYQQQRHIGTGYKNVRKNLGSLTFAAIVITIIRIIRMLAQDAQRQSQGIIKIIFCIMACILSCIEGFVNVLNHNAIIVMSLTGQNYIDSAKSAISLIFSNAGLFYVVDFITGFIEFYSIFFCCIIPALVGAGIIWSTQKSEQTSVVGGFVIFFLSWLLTSIILGIFIQVLSSVFIMYCVEKKLRNQGVIIGNIPKQIKNLFNQADPEGGFGITHNNNDKLPQTQMNLQRYNEQQQVKKQKRKRKSKIEYEDNQNIQKPKDPYQNNNVHPFYQQQNI